MSNDPIADLIAGRFPDSRGRFGPFGGRYVPETLIPALDRLEQGVRQHLHGAAFQQELAQELTGWAGRPTALTFAGRLSERWGARIWLKREDLAHTGAHKINNAIGQALLARAAWRARRVVAETGAGQHGVARRGVACAQAGAAPARCTWAPSTWSGRHRTSIACASSAQPSRR